MARRWSGFLPQNQDIKEQWGVLEESQSLKAGKLQTLAKEMGVEEADLYEEELDEDDYEIQT
jgi:hypothetical protein